MPAGWAPDGYSYWPSFKSFVVCSNLDVFLAGNMITFLTGLIDAG